MEKRESTDLFDIEFNEEKNCLYHVWKTETRQASWDQIRSAFTRYVEFMENFKPVNALVDERQMLHIFIPEEQEWIDKNMIPRVIATGLKKTAIVQSEDIYVEVATDMMMQQQSASSLQTQFFKSFEDAEEWISS